MPQQVSEVISKAKAIGIVAIVCGRKEASAASAIGDSIARSGRPFEHLALVQRSHGLRCLSGRPADAGGFATRPRPFFHARGATLHTPNKAPEPTRGAVTPRANERKIEMAMQTEIRHDARGAPAPRVAHL